MWREMYLRDGLHGLVYKHVDHVLFTCNRVKRFIKTQQWFNLLWLFLPCKLFHEWFHTIIAVRDHFRFFFFFFFLGGHQNVCPNYGILARKSNMFGQCIFCPTWGRGGGGCLEENTTLLKWLCIGNHGGCGRGYPPPTVGTLLDFGVLKPGFLWVIRFKLTSTLAPNVYDCSIRGDRSLLLRNVLDTKGEGESPSHGGDVFGFWGTKTRFLVGYKV